VQNQFEVEQKFYVDDEQALLRMIADADFTECDAQRHEDVYFRHPCRDFRETDEAFRIRRVDGAACLTYKGQRLPGDVRARREIELAVDGHEYDSWVEMLRQLGFEPLPALRKLRRVYRRTADRWTGSRPGFEAFTLCVDQVEQLGLFAEVELLITGPGEVEAARGRVLQLGERLGLQRRESSSYLNMLLDKLGFE
jgi:adenylate cyclase, class 2